MYNFYVPLYKNLQIENLGEKKEKRKRKDSGNWD